MPPTRSQVFQTALQHHQAGRFDQAEAIYRQLLAQAPDAAAAMQMLGVLCVQTSRGNEGIELIRQAIALKPTIAEWHFNLGNALLAAQRDDEEIAAYGRALELKPQQSAIRQKVLTLHMQRGQAHRKAGRLDQAVASFQ